MRNSPYRTVSRAKPALFALAAGLAMCRGAIAADGDLDPTFGTLGFVLTGLTAVGFELPAKPVVQPDGRILICSRIDTGGPSVGDFFVARFNPDGTPDTDFDFDGKVTIDFDSRDEGCNALALQPDGKIVAIGSSTETAAPNTDFAIARLMPDGTPDPTFGAGTGKTIVPFDLGSTNGDTAATATLQPDGKILVAGWAAATIGTDMAVVRLMPDGSRDTTFNSTGRVTIPFDFPGTDSIDQADSLIVEDSGRILVGGIAETGVNAFDFALARLLPNGQLDSSFDADGRVTLAFDLGATDSDISYQTILQHDGKIVMVGGADTGSGTSNQDVAITRLLADGSPDPDFGIGGKVVVPFDLTTNGNDIATGVVEDGLGRIVVVGGGLVSTTDAAAIALRLLPDGAPDNGFGNFGKKAYNFGGSFQLFTGVALQGTQIIASGIVQSGASPTVSDNVVARLEVDLIFADGFE
jgi:uncharacterized delta-60 repeat protein